MLTACRICLLMLEPEEFVKNKAFKNGLDTICKKCSREKVKLWRKENPEKKKAQVNKKTGKKYSVNSHLKRLYNITEDVYNEMFLSQGGKCAICFTHQSTLNKRLFVDHCHTTGKIRGLLCHHCNILLGSAKDSLEILLNASSYLKHNGTK